MNMSLRCARQTAASRPAAFSLPHWGRVVERSETGWGGLGDGSADASPKPPTPTPLCAVDPPPPGEGEAPVLSQILDVLLGQLAGDNGDRKLAAGEGGALFD